MHNKAVQAHHGFIEAIQQNIQGSRMCQGHIQKQWGEIFSKVISLSSCIFMKCYVNKDYQNSKRIFNLVSAEKGP